MWQDLFTLRLKQEQDKGDKILLPVSALEALVKECVDYPLLFCLSSMHDNISNTHPGTRTHPGNNTHPGRKTHSGVLEFSAPEGTVLVPPWMASNLGVQPGDIVHVANASLPKASYAKFRILTNSLWDVTDMRSLLENGLRHHSCLTVGDVVVMGISSRMGPFSLEVTEVLPEKAVCIIETDCEVDFEERPPPPPPTPLSLPVQTGSRPDTGTSHPTPPSFRAPGRFSSLRSLNTSLFPGTGHSLG